MIRLSINLLVVYSAIQLFRLLLIKLEGYDYSIKRFALKPHGTKTLGFGFAYRSLLSSVILAMITLFLGAVTGAVASSIYQAPKVETLLDFGEYLSWFFDKTLGAPGAYLFMSLIILLLEILGFIFIYFLVLKRDPEILEEIYGSIQVGDINPDSLHDEYREKLLADIDNMFESHPLVKSYRSIDSRRVLGWRVRKIIISYVLLIPSMLALLIEGFIIQINDERSNSAMQVLLSLFICIVIFLTLTFQNFKIENKLQMFRRNQLQPGYDKLVNERDYIKMVLKRKKKSSIFSVIFSRRS